MNTSNTKVKKRLKLAIREDMSIISIRTILKGLMI